MGVKCLVYHSVYYTLSSETTPRDLTIICFSAHPYDDLLSKWNSVVDGMASRAGDARNKRRSLSSH